MERKKYIITYFELNEQEKREYCMSVFGSTKSDMFVYDKAPVEKSHVVTHNENVTVTAKENFRLGKCHFSRDGVTHSYRKGIEYIKQAAEQGLAEAQSMLGDCFYGDVLGLGKGVPQSYKEAVKWYKLAAEQGFAKAQSKLGDCFYYGKGVRRNYEEAVRWYKLAAEQGFAKAQSKLADCFYYGRGVPKDFKEVIKWCELAEKQGYCTNLGYYLTQFQKE